MLQCKSGETVQKSNAALQLSPGCRRSATSRYARFVRRAEISRRAHLDQPGDGAPEGERLLAVAGRVERRGFRRSRRDQLDAMIVERVDQQDQPPGNIAPLLGDDRNAVDDQ